jgi:hypothetical protein
LDIAAQHSDTAHISVLNFAAPDDGHITDVRLHLGGAPTGDGSRWEVAVFTRLDASSCFSKIRSLSIRIDATQRTEQTVTLDVPLFIRKGFYPALINRDGKMGIRYTRGWETGEKSLSCWYLERRAEERRTPPMKLWNGRIGWCATMCPVLQKPKLMCPRTSIAADFGALVNDAPSSDVEFFVGETTTFYAHRLILATRSEFFRAMLTGGFAEADVGVIPLPNADPRAFALLLDFLYTDTLSEKLDYATAFPLLRLAAQHCCARLLALCEAEIRTRVTEENVVSVAIAAKEHGATQLLEYCQYFAAKCDIDVRDIVDEARACEEERSDAGSESGSEARVGARRDRSTSRELAAAAALQEP